MREGGGVSKEMDFRIKFLFLTFIVYNKIVLERGLDFMIISIFVPVLS